MTILKKIALATVALGLVTAAHAQQPAPQVPAPTITQKAGDVATQAYNKLTTGTTPAPQVQAPAATAAKKVAPININKATAAELDTLPSIGEARTKAIIAGRPYKSVQELADRKILPKDAFESIKDKVAVK